MERRYNIKIQTLIVLIATWILSSCNDFEKLNQNPDAVTSKDVDPGKQLGYIEASLSGSRYEQWRTNAIYTMGFTQLMTGSWAFGHGSYYIKNDGYLAALWEIQYPREIKECVDIIGNTDGNEDKTNINAIARIMKVFIFHRLTDLYGDIPYFDAGQAYNKGIYITTYDKQSDIYADFFKELDIASAALDPTKDVVTGDLFFEGDIVKWQKFANSLRLRLALRLSKINPSKASSEVKKAVSGKGGLISDISSGVVLRHENTPFSDNGWVDIRGNGLSHVFNVGTESAYLSDTLVNYMKQVKDPKLTMLGRVYSQQIVKFNDIEKSTDLTDVAMGADKIMGMKMGRAYDFSITGFTLDKAGETYEMINTNTPLQVAKEFRSLGAPFTHMTYAEVEFMLADAITRGYTSGDAEEHFKKGLEASIDHLVQVYEMTAPSSEAVTDFINSNPLNSDKNIALEQINTQLWVNHFLNGTEAYANWRRSGFPQLKFVQNTENAATSIPRRMTYPISEQSANKEKWQEAVDRFPNKKDDWENRVWWDKE